MLIVTNQTTTQRFQSRHHQQQQQRPSRKHQRRVQLFPMLLSLLLTFKLLSMSMLMFMMQTSFMAAAATTAAAAAAAATTTTNEEFSSTLITSSTSTSTSSTAERTADINININISEKSRNRSSNFNNNNNNVKTSTNLELPTFLSSHMVLQREPQHARLWGWADDNSKVIVTILNSDDEMLGQVSTIAKTITPNKNTNTDDELQAQPPNWQIEFPPQAPQINCTVYIEATSPLSDVTTLIVLDDVAFGDVFFCSGQSNMVMSISGAFNATQEIQDTIHYPHIRIATVANTIADEPQYDAHSKTEYSPSPESNYLGWIRASAPNAMNSNDPFSWFSASCYFFGRTMYQYYNDNHDKKVHAKDDNENDNDDYDNIDSSRIRPIGLIVSAWGGQKVETFSSPDALADETCGGIYPSSDNNDKKENADEVTSIAKATYPASAATATTSTRSQIRKRAMNDQQEEEHYERELQDIKDSQLWNSMIHPLINTRMVGAVWYQGEANDANATNYACKFPSMITDWRRKMGYYDENDSSSSSFAFAYVQLAGFETESKWPLLRAAQDVAHYQLPNVGVAHALDLGDPESPCGAIHPRRKQEVGRRLALSMQAILLKNKKKQLKQEQQNEQGKDNENNNNGDEYGEKDEEYYDWTGPLVTSVQLVEDNSVAIIHFDPKSTGRSSGSGGDDGKLHLHGTGGCTECCDENSTPFQIMNNLGVWSTAKIVDIQNTTITITSSSSSSSMSTSSSLNEILGIHLHWENFPQCALYNGLGGPDDHLGLPAAPMEWCAYPVPGEGPWTGNACGIPSSLSL